MKSMRSELSAVRGARASRAWYLSLLVALLDVVDGRVGVSVDPPSLFSNGGPSYPLERYRVAY